MLTLTVSGDGSGRSLGLLTLNLFDLHLGQAFVAFKQKIQVHGMMLISYQECWDLFKADMEPEKESEEVEVPF